MSVYINSLNRVTDVYVFISWPLKYTSTAIASLRYNSTSVPPGPDFGWKVKLTYNGVSSGWISSGWDSAFSSSFYCVKASSWPNTSFFSPNSLSSDFLASAESSSLNIVSFFIITSSFTISSAFSTIEPACLIIGRAD